MDVDLLSLNCIGKGDDSDLDGGIFLFWEGLLWFCSPDSFGGCSMGGKGWTLEPLDPDPVRITSVPSKNGDGVDADREE